MEDEAATMSGCSIRAQTFPERHRVPDQHPATCTSRSETGSAGTVRREGVTLPHPNRAAAQVVVCRFLAYDVRCTPFIQNRNKLGQVQCGDDRRALHIGETEGCHHDACLKYLSEWAVLRRGV